MSIGEEGLVFGDNPPLNGPEVEKNSLTVQV